MRVEAKTAGDAFCELSVDGCAPESSTPTHQGKVPEWLSHLSFFVSDPATASLNLEAFVVDKIASQAAKHANNAANLAAKAANISITKPSTTADMKLSLIHI